MQLEQQLIDIEQKLWTNDPVLGISFGYSLSNLTLLGDKLLFTALTGVDSNGFSNNIELYGITVPCKTKPDGAIKCKWDGF